MVGIRSPDGLVVGLAPWQPPWSFVTRENKSFTSNSLFPGGRREMFLSINGSPTDYLREILVLANEMFNSPPVSPGPCLCSCASNKEETFLQRHGHVFLFFPMSKSSKDC
jgi:hypothetical protein